MKSILKFTAVLLLLCGLLHSCQGKREVLVITFLDVGQGDAAVLQIGESAILIDTGTESSQSQLIFDLKALGISEIALLVLTHPDEDHIGGADGILESFPVARVWENGRDGESNSFQRLHSALDACNIHGESATVGSEFYLNNLRLTVLSPTVATKDDNASSLILRLEYGSVSALFMGDGEASAEKELLSSYPAGTLDCDLLKVGHHGSKTSSSADFLRAATPEYAVISCGAGNSYGHPHGEVLFRLESSGATVKRTDLSGQISFFTDGTNLSLN